MPMANDLQKRKSPVKTLYLFPTCLLADGLPLRTSPIKSTCWPLNPAVRFFVVSSCQGGVWPISDAFELLGIFWTRHEQSPRPFGILWAAIYIL